MKRVKDNKIHIKYLINIIYPYNIHMINTLETFVKYFGLVVSHEALGPALGGYTVEKAPASRISQSSRVGERDGVEETWMSLLAVRCDKCDYRRTPGSGTWDASHRGKDSRRASKRRECRLGPAG